MPSPFPGMNPYLEQDDAWEDFHNSYLTHARDMLSSLVGENYFVKVEVRLFLHELSATERQYFARADIGVSTAPTQGTPAAAAASVRAPLRLTLPAVAIDAERQVALEIRDRRHRRVVTAIELLSPANKAPGPDRDDYLRKRKRLLRSMTHLVEIDLRRGGRRPEPPELPECAYYALVSRYQDRPQVDVWPLGLRDPLPVIPIPLTAPDPDVLLDLKAVLDRTYDSANYGKYIYTETPEPPLSAEDEAWACQFIPPHP